MWRNRITNKAGLDYINYIAEKFNIILDDTTNTYDKKLVEEERDVFVEKLLGLKDNYISSKRAKTIDLENKKLREEKENGFKQQYAEKQENFERNMRDMFERSVENNKQDFEDKLLEYKQEIAKLKHKIEVWKAKYTEQSDANAKLITTNTVLFNKLEKTKEE